MDKQFEPLASGEVLSVDRSVQILLGQTTFRASELAAALKAVVLAQTQGSPAQADWFSDRGVPCEALRFGARGWQRGRVRIRLEFHPDSDELQPDARTNEAPDLAIAPPPAPAPAPDSDDWLEPVEMPASEPSAALPAPVEAALPAPAEDEGELEPATETGVPDIEPHEIEDVFEDAPPPPFALIDDSDEEPEAPLTADSDVEDIFADAPEPDLDDLSGPVAGVDESSELLEGDSFFEDEETSLDEDGFFGTAVADEPEAEDELFADDATEELFTAKATDEDEGVFSATDKLVEEGEDLFGTTGESFESLEEGEDLFGATSELVEESEDIFGTTGESLEEGEDLFGATSELAEESEEGEDIFGTGRSEDIFAADATSDDDPFGMVEDEGSDDLFGAIANEAGDRNEAGLFDDDEDDLFGSGATDETDDLRLDLDDDSGAIALGSADDELVASDDDDFFGDSDEFSLDLGDDLDDDTNLANGKEEKDVFEDIWQDIDDLPSN